jgi:hypothetical protein
MDVLVATLQSLRSSNNDERKAAEAHYTLLKTDSNALANNLITILSEPNHTSINDIRVMAAVLLRGLLIDDGEESLFMKMNSIEQEGIRTKLLLSLSNQSDDNMHLRTYLIDIIGAICMSLNDANEWPEIFSFSTACIQSKDLLELETGLLLINHMSSTFIEIILDAQHFTLLLEYLCYHVQSTTANNCHIMLASLRALNSLVSIISRPSIRDKFLPIIIPCLNGLTLICDEAVKTSTTVNSSTDNSTNSTSNTASLYIEVLIDMIESSSFLFEAELLLTYETVMNKIEEHMKYQYFQLTQQLIEFLVTMSEIMPKLCRKMKDKLNTQKSYFASRLLPVCARLMTNIDDEENWEKESTIEDMKDNSIFDIGEQSFDRITQAIGLRSTFTIVFNILKELLGTNNISNWKCRFAGIQMISNYVDITTRIPERGQLEQHRSDISSTLIAYAADPHPRVRAASFYGLTSFIGCHGDGMNEEEMDKILQVLLTSLSIGNNPSPRVRREVLLALVSSLSMAHKSSVERWSGMILGHVSSSLQDGPVIVQEQCICVILTLAESAHSDVLAKYYSSLMPIMQRVLAYAQESSLDTLWGSTLVCCTVIGEASGIDTFRSDAESIMGVLIALHNDSNTSQNVNRQLLQAWVNIARCLGSEFVPYLGPVMLRIFETIDYNKDEVEKQVSEDDLDAIDNESDMDIMEVKDGFLAFRTSAVEELASACQLIHLVAERMQENFYPYVEQTTRSIVPLLQSPHEDIRCFAVMALPDLVRATSKADTTNTAAISHISSYIIGQLLEFLQSESIIEIILIGLKSLKSVVEYSSINWSSISSLATIPILSSDQLHTISDTMQNILRDSIQRRAVCRAEASISQTDTKDVNDDDVDGDNKDDETRIITERRELHFHISELIKIVITTHNRTFASLYIDLWHPMLYGMLHEYCLDEDKEFAIDIIYHMMEFGFRNTNSLTFSSDDETQINHFIADCLPSICKCASMTSSTKSCYKSLCTINIASELYAKFMHPYMNMIIETLHKLMIYESNVDSVDICAPTMCTDYATMVLGNVLEIFQPILAKDPSFDFNSVKSQWLHYLPLRVDKDAGHIVITQLLRNLKQFIHTGNIHLDDISNNIPAILTILVDVIRIQLSNPSISREIYDNIRVFLNCYKDQPEAMKKINEILGTKERVTIVDHILATDASSTCAVGGIHGSSNQLFYASPGATAPIHDVLIGNM